MTNGFFNGYPDQVQMSFDQNYQNCALELL